MKRRNFLRTAGAAAASVPFIQNGFSVTPMAQNSLFAQLGASAQLSGKIMVFIELNGGNDGLNTLIPLDQYGNLSLHRSNLLIPENQVLALDGVSGTGLHPAMNLLQEMYNDGLLNIVQNVGYPNQDYSHFRSMDVWQTASASDQYLDTGWLGRMLEAEFPGFPDGFPSEDNPDPLALQIGSIVPIMFMGSAYPMGMSISDANAFYEFVNDFVEPAPPTPYGDELEYIRLVMQQSQQYYEAIKGAAEMMPANLSGKYPATAGENPLADQLRIVARLIGGGMKTPIYVVSIGGFDTHSEQVEGSPTMGAHANLLYRISQAVCAFQDDLQLMGRADDVCGMTFSEFGRTIGENGSLGTDHGAAAPLFVFGKGVNPGIIGANPVIPQDLNASADLPMTHDFRQVYASVLQDWFGLNYASDLLFGDFDVLPIFKGTTGTSDTTRRDKFAVGNYPNPVRSKTTITFTSPNAHVEIHLLDGNGRHILKIAEGNFPAGAHSVVFDRSSLNAGTYFYQVKINGVGVTKKMLVI